MTLKVVSAVMKLFESSILECVASVNHEVIISKYGITISYCKTWESWWRLWAVTCYRSGNILEIARDWHMVL